MHEVHHGGGHAKSAGALALELLMICVGVFLGLQVDQWREGRAKAELAHRTLANFRDEITANRAAIAGVLLYHHAMDDSLRRLVNRRYASGARTTFADVFQRTGYDGSKTRDLQTTAYDLAIATQALGELPPDLGLRVARVYTRQRALSTFQDQFGQSVIVSTPAPRDDYTRLSVILQQGMHEIGHEEDQLVAAYDSVLPPLTAALGRGGVRE